VRYAEGCFQLVCGDLAAACSKYQECVERSDRGALMWYMGVTGVSEALLALDRPTDARVLVQEALDLQAEWPGESCWPELVRSLAIADAKLRRPDAALRLEASIAEQQRMGASGVRLGLSYEARARIALWQDDAVAFARYTELTAREYRYGAGSALGARYHRLINEARRRGLQPAAATGSLASVILAQDDATLDAEVKTLVLLTMARESNGPGRARAALELICAAHATDRGHLYVPAGAALVRVASLGHEPPLPDLDQLRDLITKAGEHASEVDEMTTGELSDEAPGQTFRVGAATYELLLLSCVRANQTLLAGVAVVEVGTSTVDRQRSVQLRYALAAHVLEAGDSIYLE
jgi:hypothetical protein